MSYTDLKLQRLEECVTDLRHIVRHNGAAIPPAAGIAEIAEHVLDISPERVKTLWTDINTIDRVKSIIFGGRWTKRPELTTEELLTYEINDARLTAEQASWAVVRITKTGIEILTYGGNYYQKYTAVSEVDPENGETVTAIRQQGDTELLRKMLEAEDAAWMCQWWESPVSGKTYSEGGKVFLQIPCELPGNLNQLICIRILRSKLDGTPAKPLEYSLSGKTCDTATAGMIGLPHGMWLIYDNSNLQSAPRGLMIPKALAEGKETGYRFDQIEIAYSTLLSGMERLRLVGEAFGEEYVISSQDYDAARKGTWKE